MRSWLWVRAPPALLAALHEGRELLQNLIYAKFESTHRAQRGGLTIVELLLLERVVRQVMGDTLSALILAVGNRLHALL